MQQQRKRLLFHNAASRTGQTRSFGLQSDYSDSRYGIISRSHGHPYLLMLDAQWLAFATRFPVSVGPLAYSTGRAGLSPISGYPHSSFIAAWPSERSLQLRDYTAADIFSFSSEDYAEAVSLLYLTGMQTQFLPVR